MIYLAGLSVVTALFPRQAPGKSDGGHRRSRAASKLHEGRVNGQESNGAWAAQGKRMRLRPDLALLPLDDEAVAFSEGAQCLLGLNASAALVVRELQKGTRVSELAGVLASRGFAAPEEAEHWVMATLDAFKSHDMLGDGPAPSSPSTVTLGEDGDQTAAQIADMPPYAPFEAATERRYRLLETCALIRFGSLAQVRLVNSVIGHLATDDRSAPTIVIDLGARMLDDGNLRSDIYRDRIPVGCTPRLSMLAPMVKAALWQSAVNAHDFLFYIHAGVVGTGTGCILLPAAAGSGKSSLVGALAHHGFRYFSDEVALIEPSTFHVPPMPLAMCIKSTGWDLMAPYYPGISALPTHRRGDAKVLRYIPPPEGAAQQAASPVSHIIFPRHEKDAPTELKAVTRSEALGRLMGECLALRQRLDHENVGELVRWIAGIECYALTFSSLDAAAELVARAAAH